MITTGLSPQYIRRTVNRIPLTLCSQTLVPGDEGSTRGVKSQDVFRRVGNTIYDDSTNLCWIARPSSIIPGRSAQAVPTPRGVWSASVNYSALTFDLVQGNGTPDTKFYIAIAPSGPAGIGPVTPPNPAYWLETPWTRSAANAAVPLKTWTEYLAMVGSLTYDGFGPWSAANPNGWRMATLIELMTIFDPVRTYIYPELEIVSDQYVWSSTVVWNQLVGFLSDDDKNTRMMGVADKIGTGFTYPVRTFT